MFDVDLTLIDSAGAGQIAMRAAGEEVCGEHFSFEGVSFGGRLDPLIFADAISNCGFHDEQADQMHDDFRKVYTRKLSDLLNNNAHPVTALPGIPALIDNLRQRASEHDDVMLGLLTGNYAQTATMKIEAAGIRRDWFTLGCFGDEADSRPGLSKLAIQRYAQLTGTPTDTDRVIIIGDTEHDIHCAKTNGCTAFGVATGRVSAEALKKAGADIVVSDLSDPTPLLSMLA